METNWVGVDTHKETLACYKNGKFKEFKTTQKDFEKALAWAGQDSKWAIEGAYCFGKPLVAYLIKNGSEVYEVNPLLTKTWRRTIAISNPKNDFGDAKVISMFANTVPLQQVSLQTVKLKEKLTARNLSVKQRTKIINSIKMLFSIRGESLPFKSLKTQKACKWLSNHNDIIIKNFGIVLIALNTAINELEKDIETNLPTKAQELIKEFKGIGNIAAATIYTETKGKLISSSALASYAGIAPIDNSSGKKVKHRNNKAGNRILNSVFFRLSIHQIRFDENAKAYYEKKLAEGKSKRLARKHVARQLVKKVYNVLVR
jgi:transposase